MNELKPIRQLPELEEHQEWTCEVGCDHIEPKLHRNIYAESWDLEGNKTREEAEHYYTCQHGHVLSVWDTLLNKYEDLPEYVFKDRENRFGWDIGNVDSLLQEIQKTEAAYSGEDMKDSPFRFAKASFTFTLKTGEEVSVDKNYLNELKAQLLESESVEIKSGKCSCSTWLKNAIGGNCGECGELIEEGKESYE